MTRALWIPDALSKFGCDFTLEPGWETRGSTDFDPAGVVCHHTAVKGSAVNVCITGRSDLPGPLANIVLARAGRAHVIAAGRANHAGQGGWNGLSGNRKVLGVEADNDGTEPWPSVQVAAFHLVCAALVDGMHTDPSFVCFHREWAPHRKTDPHTLDMGEFRAAVGLDLHTHQQGDDEVTEADLMKIIDGVADEVLKRLADDTLTAGNRLRKAAHAAQHLHDHAGLTD